MEQPIKAFFKNHVRIRIFIGIYAVLWILTATWGISDIDRLFDQTYQYGHMFAESPKEPVIRVKRIDVADPDSPYKRGITHFWKYRSHGWCLAPFIVLDTAGYQDGGMSGIGGKRLVLWFFGWIKAFWYRVYWVS